MMARPVNPSQFGGDVVGRDLADLPGVLQAITRSFDDGPNKVTASTFSSRLFDAQRRSNAHLDLVIIGVECSLWVAEQWAVNLRAACPSLRIVVASSNKALAALTACHNAITCNGATPSETVFPPGMKASTACRHAVEAFIPGGNTVSDGVAPLQVMALWQAVNAAKALLDEATTMRKEGHAARRFTAHCSATQSEHSTPMMTRSKCALERLCASKSLDENVDAVTLFGPSSKDRVIACKTPGKSARSLPTTSPPNCEGLTGLAIKSDTPSKSSSVAKVP